MQNYTDKAALRLDVETQRALDYAKQQAVRANQPNIDKFNEVAAAQKPPQIAEIDIQKDANTQAALKQVQDVANPLNKKDGDIRLTEQGKPKERSTLDKMADGVEVIADGAATTAQFVAEVPTQIAGGVIDGTNELLQSVNELATYLDTETFLPDLGTLQIRHNGKLWVAIF